MRAREQAKEEREKVKEEREKFKQEREKVNEEKEKCGIFHLNLCNIRLSKQHINISIFKIK